MKSEKLYKILVGSIMVILLTFVTTPLFGQSDTISTLSESSAIQLSVPQTPVIFRVPEKEKILEYQKDSKFSYQRVERSPSLWNKFKYWFFDLFNGIASAVIKSGFPGIAVVIIFVIIICLIVLKLLGVDYKTIFRKKKLDTPEIDIYTENVHAMDFETLIANAMKNKDYRLAVRFLYLKNLKQLSDKEIIDWKANKTNYSYQHEINNISLRSKFLEATLIFDYIWYGEFTLDDNKFSEVYTRMNEFNQMIGNER